MNILIISSLMALSGYVIFLIKDYINKHLSVLLMPLMILIDGIIIYPYYILGIPKFDLVTGILFGTIFKIIIFLLSQKFQNERKQINSNT
tara:strand:+ start:769 stop:1038 length:270 start_codon:yes stop_codon:yes gene_type:complete